MNEQWADWKRQVLDPLLGDRPTSVDPGAPVAILSADADRVQDYVFESARLPEIRGASMLLQALNEEAADLVRQAVHPDCVIYAGGGSLLALVPGDEALLETLCQEIEALYPQHTGVATTTSVAYRTTAGELVDGYGALSLQAVNALRRAHPADWARVAAGYEVYGPDGGAPGEVPEDAFHEHRGFGQTVKLAGMALRRRKDGRPLMPFYEALSHAQRCRSCGMRPAAEMRRYQGELWPLCAPCKSKLEGWRERRSHWIGRFEKWHGERDADRVELSGAYYAAGYPPSPGRPQDVGEIGQACRAHTGYVGLIYADGDRIGSLLESCRTPAAYKAVSDALRRATEGAVFRALAELTRTANVKRTEYDRNGDPLPDPVPVLVHPFEIVAIGGDDVLLIVPGDVALPLAVRICDCFEQGMRAALPDLPRKRLVTMSAGVVIAEAHNPIRALRDVAQQLLKRGAKRRAHDARTGGLDYLLLKSQSMLRRDIDDLRATYPIKLPGEGAQDALRLTALPYTLGQAKTVLHLLREMRRANCPTSQLHRLIEALHEGRERGSLFFLYQQARLHDRDVGPILDEIERAWRFDQEHDPVPWNHVARGGPELARDPDGEVGYTSVLPDLAELYDLTPRDPQELARWDVVLGR